MTEDVVALETLLAARETLIAEFHQQITDDEKAFLLSFKEKKPDWQLLGLDGIAQLPAVRWKLQNIGKMREGAHQAAVTKLKAVLDSLH